MAPNDTTTDDVQTDGGTDEDAPVEDSGDDVKNINPDCTCPECGFPAEKGNVTDARDSGGKKFRSYIHKRSESGTVIKDSCVEVLAE